MLCRFDNTLNSLQIVKTLKDLLAVDRNEMAKFNLKMEKFN